MSQERPRISMRPSEVISQEARAGFANRYGVELTPRNFRRAVKEMLFSMSEAALLSSLQTSGRVPFQGHGDPRRKLLTESNIVAEIQESRTGAIAYLHPDGGNTDNNYSFPLREPALAFSGNRFRGEKYSEILQALLAGNTQPLQEEFEKTVDLLSDISGNDLRFLKPYFLHYDPQELIIAGRFPARYADGQGEAPPVEINNDQARMLLDVLGIRSWKNFVQQYGEQFKTLPLEAIGIIVIETQELAKGIGLTINPNLLNDPNSIPGFIREHIGDDYEGYGFTFASYYALTGLFPNLNQHARMAGYCCNNSKCIYSCCRVKSYSGSNKPNSRCMGYNRSSIWDIFIYCDALCFNGLL